MKYKISIIVPVYNVAKHIDKCLNTLLNQTMEEIEIITVNDKSSDNSLEILEKYKEKFGDKIKVVDLKQNLKQGGARNAGIEIASGDYIGFVDPDDYVELHMFEKLYKTAISENADIVTCDYYEVQKNGDRIIYKSNNLPEGEITKEKLKKILLRKYGWELWQQLYKREIFTNNNIKFSENLYVTDLEIGALLIMFANKIAKVREALYYYVKHDNATTSFKIDDKKVFDLITVSEKRLTHFKIRNLYYDFHEELDYIYFWHVGIVSTFRCVVNFSKPQKYKIEEIKYMLENQVPNIRKNNYYKNSNSVVKLYYSLLFNNSTLLVFLLRLVKYIPTGLSEYIKKIFRK